MKKGVLKFILVFSVTLIFIFPVSSVFIFKPANLGFFPNFLVSAEENYEDSCQSIEKIEKECDKIASSECQVLLKKCEQYYSEKSVQIEKDITKTKNEKKNLQNAIYSLGKKIKNLNYKINQSNLIIKDLGFQIKDTEKSIGKTSTNIEDYKEKLAQTLRLIHEEDRRSVVEILLSEPELSGFFNNLAALESLNLRNQELLKNIKDLKSYLQSQKDNLGGEKDDLEKVVVIQTIQKRESDKTKKEKNYFLKLTEAEYQKHLKEKKENEKKAAEIKAKIFELIGVPKSPNFGEALELAKYVEKITGVRPAFLLAILKQESNIGKNVGQCYLKDTKTGSGVRTNGKKISNVMSPSSQIPSFLKIIKGLAEKNQIKKNPFNVPVSCPIPSDGKFGGAMGPAQFMPSTWLAYKENIKKITGKPADPWNIKDAFLASALYLKDAYNSRACRNYAERNKNISPKQLLQERCTAAKYYAGGYWYSYRWTYGQPVIKKAEEAQKKIDIIESAK